MKAIFGMFCLSEIDFLTDEIRDDFLKVPSAVKFYDSLPQKKKKNTKNTVFYVFLHYMLDVIFIFIYSQ